jgi:hypothetical protein
MEIKSQFLNKSREPKARCLRSKRGERTSGWKRESAVAGENRGGRFYEAEHRRCKKTAFLPTPEWIGGDVCFFSWMLETGGSEGGSGISGSLWSRQNLQAFADLAIDKVEDPLEWVRC